MNNNKPTFNSSISPTCAPVTPVPTGTVVPNLPAGAWITCYLRGIEPQLIKLEFIIYLPKLKVCPICLYLF